MDIKILQKNNIKKGYIIYFSKEELIYQTMEYSIVNMKVKDQGSTNKSVVFRSKGISVFEDGNIEQYLLNKIRDNTILLIENECHPLQIQQQIQRKVVEYLYEEIYTKQQDLDIS